MSRQRDERGRYVAEESQGTPPDLQPKGDMPTESDSGDVAKPDTSSPGKMEAPADPFQEFLQTLEDEFTTIKERLLGLELTIKQMGAAPVPADPLKGLMEGPLGSSIENILKEVPSMIRNFTGGGVSEFARSIDEKIRVKEKERVDRRIDMIVEAAYSDKELQMRDKEE